MTRTPLISVVIPFYRGEDFLAEAIESVMLQTFQDFEVVLVDNNANLRSKKIADEWALRYPETIRVLHERVQGACSARNKGIRESRGQYIALLDEDDLMFPRRLENQISFLEKHPEISLVTSYFDIISHDGKEAISQQVKTYEHSYIGTKLIREIFMDVYNGSGHHFKGNHDHRRNLDSFHLTYPSTFFFLKDLAKQAGMFNTRFNPGLWEDTEFQTRMFSWGDFFQLPESLAFYRDTSPDYEMKNTYNHFEKIFVNEHIFQEILYRQYWRKGRGAQTAIRRLRYRYLKKLGTWLFSYPDGDRLGRKFLTLAIKENPYSLEIWKLFVKSYFPQSMHPRFFWFPEFKPTKMGEFGVALQKISHSWPPVLIAEDNPTS